MTGTPAAAVLAGMPSTTLWSITAPSAQGTLRAFEPTRTEIIAAAPLLALFNNDRYNAAMMTNTLELTASDIVDFYQSLRDTGGRPFLLEQGGVLMGDADFRNVAGPAAEFAILVGSRGEQGRGLGTRYAAMAHLAARRVLGYERVYVTITPANLASRRLFEKLGYRSDKGSYAASLREAEDDIVMSIDWARFEREHCDFLAQVVVSRRISNP